VVQQGRMMGVKKNINEGKKNNEEREKEEESKKGS
jgi:hypothetical protein